MDRRNFHKNFRALLVLILVLTAGATLFSQTLIEPNNSFIKYSGRIDTTSSEYPTFSYSGVRIRAKFEGSSLKIKMNNISTENYFFVIIDNTITQKIRVSQGLSDYLVASDLDDTFHTVEIVKVTEGSVGKCEFRGFVLDEGKTLSEMLDDNGRNIEFIGNSITCGYGIEVLDENLHFDNATENFYDTYACITARAFDADYKAVSKSGIGIYRNYNGPSTGSADNMLNIYDQMFYNQKTPQWDFSDDHPDIIAINLGTNDFSTSGGGNKVLFEKNYDDLISLIRVNNPTTKIILLMGPMTNSVGLKGYLNSIVAMQKEKGDENVYYFEMTNQSKTNSGKGFGLGADWHPSRRQHRENASELISFIETITDWDANAIVKDIEVVKNNEIRLSFDTYLEAEQNNAVFKVTKNDETEISVSSFNVDPDDKRNVYLYLDSELKFSDELTVSYLDNTLQGANGEGVEYFYSQPADNLLTESTTPSTVPAAPIPTQDEANVISVYSDTYTNIASDRTDWWATSFSPVFTGDDEMTLTVSECCFGFTFDYDLSLMSKLHVDIYPTTLGFVNYGVVVDGNGFKEGVYLTANQWNSIDISLSDLNVDLDSVNQVGFWDLFGTFYFDNIYFYSESTAKLSDVSNTEMISFYPNPIKDQITISSVSEISQVRVLNLVGQTLQTISVNDFEESIDLSNLNTGSYFVAVKLNDGELSTHKIVKL